jgi:predicted P-loop ATPase
MIEENGNEVKKERINTIYLRARMCFNSKEITKDLLESIMFSDLITQFNPITEYIERNSWRNSTGNINRIINTIKTDTDNADLFIRKWLVSIVAAYEYNPIRSVLALVGGQNSGKTEWFRRLLPAQLRKYYAESKLDAGKDDDILMTQKLIVMDDEMGGKSKQDEKRFKELTSKQIFSLRAPYGRYNEDFKRLAILCGTSNDTNILNDSTGNTRILPINVLSINHEAYNEIDKDELFMEIYRTYQSGYEYQLSREELLQLGLLSPEFEVIPFERELILEHFKPKNQAGYVEYLTSTKIKDYIESNSKQRIMNLKRFSQELKNVFGEAILRRNSGSPQRLYACIRLNENTQSVDSEAFPF